MADVDARMRFGSLAYFAASRRQVVLSSGTVPVELSEQRLNPDQAPVEDPLRDTQEIFQQRIGRCIPRRRAAPLRDNNSRGTEPCELLRDDRLIDRQGP